MDSVNNNYTGLEIAIIGISCRVPGANNWREFWKNLIEEKESITFLAKQKIGDKKDSHVTARGILQNKDLFDAAFFNYRYEEAFIMNPVHRIFHECVWEALEDAGCNPYNSNGPVGLYAGAGEDLNWQAHTMLNKHNSSIDDLTAMQLNNKDYLSSLISYKLNLRGPSFTVNTACSTSLVAVSLACKSLLFGENKVAIAGGIAISTQRPKEYFYEEGMITSSDGHCRAFDAKATGTISGEGAGVVVLKKLKDAVHDKDNIYAIIKSTALNNDGNAKVGFAAPSVDGQADCIRRAIKLANVQSESITYVEAHGTGTSLGDPIEVMALKEAFSVSGVQKFCAIGSVKTNIGHLDAAAGVMGLIKTALCLKFRKIPASLNYSTPNPNIDFENGPFYVNTKLKDWNSNYPLRAGVSSFGIGGTNGHIILEEPPKKQHAPKKHEPSLIVLSAKTEHSLRNTIEKLKNHLCQEDPDISDLGYTLQIGRKHFGYRTAICCESKNELLEGLDITKNRIVKSLGKPKKTAFMFSGAGSQYVNMGKNLYETVPIFKKVMDEGFAQLEILTKRDFKEILFSKNGDKLINEMIYSQPIIFLFDYCLAKLILSWGIEPDFLIGHSIGEYVAACIGGVFSFESGLKLAVKRGELMNDLPEGSMLSVSIDEIESRKYIKEGVCLAAVNSPSQIVLSGEVEAIKKLEKRLDEHEISYVKLFASRAGHSHMMDSLLAEYKASLETVVFNKPLKKIISNVTGFEVGYKEITSVDYWLKHIRQPVQFSKGIRSLIDSGDEYYFIEVGAGHSLTALVRQNLIGREKISSGNLTRHPKDDQDDLKYLYERLGDIWSSGVDVNWQMFNEDTRRWKVSLPTYSFEGKKFPCEVEPLERLKVNNESVKENLLETHTKEKQFQEDTDTLPPTELERNKISSKYVAPQTMTERTLVKLFENFFSVDMIGTEDNFFELGGDSLKAMILLKRIRKDFEVKLDLKLFFEFPNIKKIAFEIDLRNPKSSKIHKKVKKII